MVKTPSRTARSGRQPAQTGTLPADALARLSDLAVDVEYGPGDVVLREGAVVDFLGVVERGRVGLRLSVPGRGSLAIVTIEPGEIVGWSAVVPPYRATAEAVATEPTHVTAFDAVALRERLSLDPALSAVVLPALLAGVSDRLTTSWQQLLDLFGGTPADPW